MTVDRYYHGNSWYIKYTLNPIGKSDKIHNNKEDKYKHLIDKAFEKFNGILSIHIIKNNIFYIIFLGIRKNCGMTMELNKFYSYIWFENGAVKKV